MLSVSEPPLIGEILGKKSPERTGDRTMIRDVREHNETVAPNDF